MKTIKTSPNDYLSLKLTALGIPRSEQHWDALVAHLPAKSVNLPDIDALAEVLIYLAEKTVLASIPGADSKFLSNLKAGNHFCLWYQKPEELLQWLVPYFEEGLRAGDYCLWNVSPPLDVKMVREALAARVGPLEHFTDQLEIVPAAALYCTASGEVRPIQQILADWALKEQKAQRAGFNRLRGSGDTAVFATDKSWKAFIDYECTVHTAIQNSKIMAVCTYDLATATPSRIADSLDNHGDVIFKLREAWRKTQIDAEARRVLPALLTKPATSFPNGN